MKSKIYLTISVCVAVIGQLHSQAEPYDIIVAITQQARTDLENRSESTTYEEEIYSAIALANAGCANSMTDIKFNLIHIEEIDIDEDTYSFTALGDGNPDTDVEMVNVLEASRLNGADFNSVNEYRDVVGADLVLTIISSDNLDYCGVAWSIPTIFNVDNWYPNAHCVVEVDCIFGNFSLHHELAHLLGSNHGDVGGGQTHEGIHAYSEGFHYGSGFRTIMAYSNGIYQTRRNFFSNPDVNDSGNATGVVNSKDNARSLDETHASLIGMNDPYVWVDSTVYGNYWRDAEDTIGWINIERYPWVYSLDHGWLNTAFGTEMAGFYFWDRGMLTWCWTSTSYWPYLYRYNAGSNSWDPLPWLFISSDQTSIRWYYNYNINDYVSQIINTGAEPTYDPGLPPAL